MPNQDQWQSTVDNNWNAKAIYVTQGSQQPALPKFTDFPMRLFADFTAHILFADKYAERSKAIKILSNIGFEEKRI